ncbi:serpin family protein [Promethearchaeum syntrophicum]|uniref:Serpin family protein n=1 Tax=Promethearchaeum syntrophicum TaxID=2594042 RepID=A0A5B9D9K8_9ARCH|nr:serpin family protein [Candidatus Prometheoarchaeum syntrophicum]QEE15948.1 Serpin (serine protease inhibitor) [Candidatus Prometheoarchaeum syntrophicum]
MHKKVLPITIALLIVGAITTTTILLIFPYDPSNPPQLDDSGSTSRGIQEVVNANNQFAFDLYSKFIESEEGNVFYSPYSIFSTLAMTYEGAKGQTADEMKSVFYFPENDVLRPNFAAIYNDINGECESYELRTGNALWCQKDFPFQEDYISRVGTYYGGKVANLDFVNEPEISSQAINNFIENQTNGRIKGLIPPGAFGPLTKLVLTNAIYFKGSWDWEFDTSKTIENNFIITPEIIVETPMMHMSPDDKKFKYAGLDDLQILELPYKGDKISMLILLPRVDLNVIEPSLTVEKLNEYKNQTQETELGDIYLPKFEFDTKYNMEETLSSLGMPTAFSGTADFSGMTLAAHLYINKVIHQAYVKVDEEGTEATAATVVIMDYGINEPSQLVFNADHPFIFLIQEQETGNILFMGRVNDPTTE